ncbi:MAG: ribbon-helix-helix protein, CopG family [Alphaproteobacteria bacterium]|nr:ribbon-helix-helix protein, CopG family [Alphaproteobacteria bacterium]
MKTELRIRLDAALGEQLAVLAQKPGTSKSAILEDALRAFVEGRAGRDLDERLRVRLERLGAQLNRIERNQHILQEGFALFVEFELQATSSVPDYDEAARAIGHQRFQSFVEELARKLAHARSFSDRVGAHLSADKDAS